MVIAEVIVFTITLALTVMLFDNIKVMIRAIGKTEWINYFILSILNIIMLILYGFVCVAIVY